MIIEKETATLWRAPRNWLFLVWFDDHHLPGPAVENNYRNMREVIDQHPEVLEAAFKGYKRVGIEPKIDPIRGGTDGAGFSFMGCPCPNLGTGSYNHHGRFEYLDVSEFHQMIDLVVAILSE